KSLLSRLSERVAFADQGYTPLHWLSVCPAEPVSLFFSPLRPTYSEHERALPQWFLSVRSGYTPGDRPRSCFPTPTGVPANLLGALLPPIPTLGAVTTPSLCLLRLKLTDAREQFSGYQSGAATPISSWLRPTSPSRHQAPAHSLPRPGRRRWLYY